MKEYPNSFWAAIFILIASIVAVVALFSDSKEAAAVITMAASIITGSFGYIQGHRDGIASSTQSASDGTETTSTTSNEKP